MTMHAHIAELRTYAETAAAVGMDDLSRQLYRIADAIEAEEAVTQRALELLAQYDEWRARGWRAEWDTIHKAARALIADQKERTK